MTQSAQFDPDTQAVLDETAIKLAKALLVFSGSYVAAKDALLKAAGMYSQAAAGWPDGDAHSQS